MSNGIAAELKVVGCSGADARKAESKMPQYASLTRYGPRDNPIMMTTSMMMMMKDEDVNNLVEVPTATTTAATDMIMGSTAATATCKIFESKTHGGEWLDEFGVRNNQSVVSTATMAVQQLDGVDQMRLGKVIVSAKACGRKSVQDMGLHDDATKALCKYGGTNVCVLDRQFRKVFDACRKVQMEGFDNELKKNDETIVSVVATKIFEDGAKCLVGIHEGAYLTNNECSLVSTG